MKPQLFKKNTSFKSLTTERRLRLLGDGTLVAQYPGIMTFLFALITLAPLAQAQSSLGGTSDTITAYTIAVRDTKDFVDWLELSDFEGPDSPFKAVTKEVMTQRVNGVSRFALFQTAVRDLRLFQTKDDDACEGPEGQERYICAKGSIEDPRMYIVPDELPKTTTDRKAATDVFHEGLHIALLQGPNSHTVAGVVGADLSKIYLQGQGARCFDRKFKNGEITTIINPCIFGEKNNLGFSGGSNLDQTCAFFGFEEGVSKYSNDAYTIGAYAYFSSNENLQMHQDIDGRYLISILNCRKQKSYFTSTSRSKRIGSTAKGKGGHSRQAGR